MLGLIPARGGSRRVPRKNLAMLGSMTLVRRALLLALASRHLDLVALSSDDPDILAEADDRPDIVQIDRPPALATDSASTYDVVLHALKVLEGAGEGRRFEIVAIIQCTSPFTTPDDIDAAIRKLLMTGSQSVVSVVRIDVAQHPLKFQRMEGDRLMPFLEDDRLRPTQELPDLWVRNGAVYVTRRAVIDAGNLVSSDVRGYPMPRERSLDVNTPMDLAFAELLLRAAGGGEGS